jgi:plastocyanin
MRDSKNVRTLAVVLAGVVAIGLAGCKPNRAIRSGAVVDNGVKPAEPLPKPAAAETNSGTVMGVVHFKGKAPARIRIDMSLDPVCGVAGGANLTEQYVVNSGGLANVYVYVKSGPTEAMNAPAPAEQPVVLDQVGCRYVPHVVALMKGGTVEFRNSDGTMHNIHTMPTENPGVDVSQGAKGAPEQRRFDKPEVMMPVRCNNHPWMNAFINVSATPFFAVTDATGRFDISGLPPGTYTLAAVHEKLGEQTLTVTVASKSQSSAEFTYTAK